MSTAVRPEPRLDLAPHRLAPGLGAEQADLERALAQVDALLLRDLGDRERIRWRRAQHARAEIHDQRDLPLGRAARHRHDDRAQPLGAVVRAQPAGEQAVAVRVVDESPGRAPAQASERAIRSPPRSSMSVARVADDGRLARRARTTRASARALSRGRANRPNG